MRVRTNCYRYELDAKQSLKDTHYDVRHIFQKLPKKNKKKKRENFMEIWDFCDFKIKIH